MATARIADPIRDATAHIEHLYATKPPGEASQDALTLFAELRNSMRIDDPARDGLRELVWRTISQQMGSAERIYPHPTECPPHLQPMVHLADGLEADRLMATRYPYSGLAESPLPRAVLKQFGAAGDAPIGLTELAQHLQFNAETLKGQLELLTAYGCITPAGEGCYQLTDSGQKLAAVIAKGRGPEGAGGA